MSLNVPRVASSGSQHCFSIVDQAASQPPGEKGHSAPEIYLKTRSQYQIRRTVFEMYVPTQISESASVFGGKRPRNETSSENIKTLSMSNHGVSPKWQDNSGE